MKKTLTVNLGGVVYNIDEDAYRLLDNYLRNLKHYFAKQGDADEIVTDIEQRISELFAEKLADGQQVITIAHVEEIISRIGKPEEMESNEKSEQPHADDATGAQSATRRRFYRNPDDRILGGVVSGLAAYMNIDVTALRLIVFFCAILGVGILIPIYLILWLFIPQANTAAEKLSMYGRAVTLENIGKTVTDGFDRMRNDVNDYVRSGKPRTAMQRVGDSLAEVIGFCLKVFLIILAIVCSPVLFVFAIVFVVLIIAAITIGVGGAANFVSMFPLFSGAELMSTVGFMICGSGLLAVGIPLLAIVFSVLGYVFNWKPMSAGLKWALIILWVLSVLGFILFFMQIDPGSGAGFFLAR